MNENGKGFCFRKQKFPGIPGKWKKVFILIIAITIAVMVCFGKRYELRGRFFPRVSEEDIESITSYEYGEIGEAEEYRTFVANLINYGSMWEAILDADLTDVSAREIEDFSWVRAESTDEEIWPADHHYLFVRLKETKEILLKNGFIDVGKVECDYLLIDLTCMYLTWGTGDSFADVSDYVQEETEHK